MDDASVKSRIRHSVEGHLGRDVGNCDLDEFDFPNRGIISFGLARGSRLPGSYELDLQL